MQPAQPTVAEVLALPEVQAGQPIVHAGHVGLSRRVRWVHVLELSNVDGLLRGGELVLSTGVALPSSNDDLRRYVEDLNRHRVSGVLLQLGERWVSLPAALLQAADRCGLPLIGLQTVVPFVAITESVHASLISSSYRELQESERLHEVFARLGTEQASPAQIVTEVAEWTGAPVVFESLNHRVLAAATAGRDHANCLGDWERRSRRAVASVDTVLTGPEGWLVRQVAAGGRTFGRLVLQPAGATAAEVPTRLQVLAVERGAAALALGRLLGRDAGLLERRAHGALLADLIDQRFRSEQDAHLRTQAAGVPTLRRSLTGVALAVGSSPADRDAALADLLSAAQRCRLSLLAGHFEEGAHGLLALPEGSDPDLAVRVLADAVAEEGAKRRRAGTLGRGPTGTELADTGRTLAAARHASLAGGRQTLPPRMLTLPEAGVYGLLAQLRHDGRLQAFVEAQLGPLLADPGTRAGHLDALRAFLDHGGNKSSAAAALRISRPALYARLDQAGVRLGVDLDDAQTRLGLHLALAAWDAAGDLGSTTELSAPP